MATTPTSNHRPGMSRCSAAPTVRHASAVTTPVPTWPPWPVAPTASTPASTARGMTRSRARTTSSTAIAASSGVVIAAASTVLGASSGTMSSPKVPTTIDKGSSAAHAGARNRARPGKGLARGRRTRTPSRMEAGTPDSALCKLKLTIRSDLCFVVNEHAGPPRPRAFTGRQRARVDQSDRRGGTALEFPVSESLKLAGVIQIPDQHRPKTSRFPQDVGRASSWVQ